MRDTIFALLLGCLLDLLLGDPEWFPHPVRLIGRLIAWMETLLRKRGGDLRRSAVILTVTTVALTCFLAALFLWALRLLGYWPHFLGMALLFWLGLSARNLSDEAMGVQKALAVSLDAGRTRVARIVGRDTGSLSAAEIILATVETVAENTTDGVISPLLYGALGGPVLMMAYKAVSTLDSMVGYLDERHRDIGWSSARLDDLLNYLPARLTALCMIAAAWVLRLDAKSALRIVKRDHRNHLSPNCAWSEAAAAGALGLQLGGTHLYFGQPVEKPAIGDAQRQPSPADIAAACRLMYAASGIAALLVFLTALLL